MKKRFVVLGIFIFLFLFKVDVKATIYTCKSGEHLSEGICYTCPSGTNFNEYDKKCYSDATYEYYCPAGGSAVKYGSAYKCVDYSNVINSLYLEYVQITVDEKTCNSKIDRLWDAISRRCVKYYGLAQGRYKCNAGTYTTLVQRASSFSSKGDYCKFSPNGYRSADTGSSSSTTTYTATFNSNGGGTPSKSSISVSSGSSIGTLPTVSRSGYTFTGWYTTASGGSKISASTKITSNVTFYAHWTSSSSTTTIYTATFNSNGGNTPNPSTIKSVSGTELGTLPTATRVGYTLAGWYTAASGGTKISSSTKITSNVTYYAHWNINKHIVTYKYTYGNGSPATPEQYRAMNCVPVKDIASYNKTEWSDTATYGSSYSIQPHWWKCDGYTFTEWNEKYDGSGVAWKAETTWNKWGTYKGDTYDRDVTLYAQWVANQYKIVYHGNGGTYKDSETWVDPRNFVYNKVYPGYDSDLPIIYGNEHFFYKKGYKFTGWETKAHYKKWTADYKGNSTHKWLWYDGYKEDNVSIGVGDETANQLDLYATWAPITYTIKFDKNATDATGSMDNIVKTYGVSTVSPTNNYVREGYVFKGWNTKADGSGVTTIKDGKTIGTLTAINENIVTLYAQWEAEDADINAKDGKYIRREANDTPKEMRKITKYRNATMFDKSQQMGENDIFKTGNKLNLNDREYTIYVFGDVNKNGEVSFADVVASYSMSKTNNTKDEVFYAADVIEDEEITFSDVIRLYDLSKVGE